MTSSEEHNRMSIDPFKPGLLERLPPPKKIAILSASRIGDFLCATPAFRALKTRLPSARFTLIGLPFVREMAERSRHLDNFEPFPGFPGIAEQFFSAKKTLAFLRRMQQRRFDLAVQMHGSGVFSNSFALMLGARSTAGFIRPGDGPGRLDAVLAWPAALHASERPLALANFLAASHCSFEQEFPLFPDDHAAAAKLLHGCKAPFIGLHPWSREPDKQWPAERFAAAGSGVQRNLGGTILVLGGPDEGRAGELLAPRAGVSAINLAGRKSLGEMGAVIARLSVLITNDSGPAHIAYALAVPSVTLFGKTDPAEWGPPDRPFHRVLRTPDRSLASISVDDVIRAAVSVAEQSRRLSGAPSGLPTGRD